MKFLTIGDVHGLDKWKNAIYRINEDTGEEMYCYLDNIIDKAIFVGDYVDAFDISNVIILHNLKEIIQLKKDYPDKVVLLMGNHDVAYLKHDHGISGHRPEMGPDLYQLFHENRDLFQLAYQYGSTIWTHAGIHEGWWMYYVQPILDGKTNTRFTPFLGECKNIADVLNLMYDFNYEPLYMCGHQRGGYDKQGGPLWAHKTEIYQKPLPGYHQVVGHNPVACPKTYDFHDLTKITFCDSLPVCDTFYKINL